MDDVQKLLHPSPPCNVINLRHTARQHRSLHQEIAGKLPSGDVMDCHPHLAARGRQPY